MNSIVESKLAATGSGSATLRRHPCCDHYDTLVRRLLLAQNGTPAPKTVGLTSCSRGAGVSTVAANLAIRSADTAFDSVLLVDADIRHPTLGREFRTTPGRGWADLLSDTTTPHEVIQPSGIERLSLLPAGTAGSALHSFQPATIANCVQALRTNYPLVVFDLPPVSELSTCLDLVGQLDGVVLVIEADKTPGEAALHVKRQLLEFHARLLGVVLNKRHNYVPGWLSRWM